MIDNGESQNDPRQPEGQEQESHSPSAEHERTQGQETGQETHNNQNSTNQNQSPPATPFFRGTLAEWITVIVTAVIALVGGLQLCVYRQQKKIMERTERREIEIARNVYGIPDVIPTPWMGVYNENGQVRWEINVYNRGIGPAKDIQVAAKMDFLDSVPSNCGFSKFVDTEPGILPKFEKGLVPYDPNDRHPGHNVADFGKAVFYYDKTIPRKKKSNL